MLAASSLLQVVPAAMIASVAAPAVAAAVPPASGRPSSRRPLPWSALLGVVLAAAPFAGRAQEEVTTIPVTELPAPAAANSGGGSFRDGAYGGPYFTGGAWAYDLRGDFTTGGQRFDFERDLGIETDDRQEGGLGYRPPLAVRADAGGVTGLRRFLPLVEANYLRISARGSQTTAATTIGGVIPLAPGDTVTNDTDVDDAEVSLRLPFRLGPVLLSAGVTVAYLDGTIDVTNQTSGVASRQSLSQVFPLGSVGLEWTPFDRLRLSARGDYVQYQGDTAQTLEAAVLVKLVGPVGLEAGYRQRRFRIGDDGDANGQRTDARLGGFRAALRFELP